MSPSAEEIAGMVAAARAMKAEGVARWGDIIMDPRHLTPPSAEVHLSPVDRAERQLAADRRREEVMFAATSVRPRTPEPRDMSNVAPRGVTPMERDDAPPQQ